MLLLLLLLLLLLYVFTRLPPPPPLAAASLRLVPLPLLLSERFAANGTKFTRSLVRRSLLVLPVSCSIHSFKAYSDHCCALAAPEVAHLQANVPAVVPAVVSRGWNDHADPTCPAPVLGRSTCVAQTAGKTMIGPRAPTNHDDR